MRSKQVLATPTLPSHSTTLNAAEQQTLLAQTPEARVSQLEADYAQAQAQLDRSDTTAMPGKRLHRMEL